MYSILKMDQHVKIAAFCLKTYIFNSVSALQNYAYLKFKKIVRNTIFHRCQVAKIILIRIKKIFLLSQ